MSEITYKEFCKKVKARTNERPGQAIMNTLTIERKDLCDRIAGTRLDCYYRDTICKETLSWLKKNW